MGSTRFHSLLPRFAVLLVTTVLACGGGDPEGPPDAGGEVCPATAQVHAVQAADRKILGAGAASAADQTLRGRDEALAASQRLRREAAWKIVAKVLAPVDLASPFPSAPTVAARLPRWQTWYAK